MENVSEAAGYGDDGFVDSSGVRIHYVTSGAGPLVVLIHGIPGFWYDWRHLMPELARHFQVVAIDQRGFNLSDQPDGIENYSLEKLVGDVDAVVEHFGQKSVAVVGHDSGGWICWHYAMARPERLRRAVILNLPHPGCIERELRVNERQYEASDYARQYQESPEGNRLFAAPDGTAVELTPEVFASVFQDDRARYLEAFRRTSIESIINFYKSNYPREPYTERNYSRVKCPVLMFHGLDDPWLMPETLNNIWPHVDNELTLVSIPGAGHWVHHDEPEFVKRRMVSLLLEGQ